MAVRSVTRTNLQQDPTSAQQAAVAGITQPAQPVAAAGIAPVVVPPITYTPTPDSSTPIIAPAVPTAATAAQAAGGIGPLSSVDTTTQLPELQDASVEAALTRLLSQDSDLMKQARTAGLQQAAQRGVLNSSIGIGAAQNEAIRAALPLAEQQAAQAAASNTQRYDLAGQMDRLRAQAGFEQIARAEGYQYQTALNTQGYTFQAQQQANQNQFTKDMAKVQQGYAVDMAGLQYTLQSKLQSQANTEQIQRMGVDFANQMKLQQDQAAHVLDQIKAQGNVQLTLQANQFQEALKELTMTLNSQNSIAMANASVNLFQAESQLRAALLSNPNMPASERSAYEAQITALTQPTRDYINSVLGYVPSAAPAPGGTPAPGPAPAPAPAPIPIPKPIPKPPSGGGIAPLPIGGGIGGGGIKYA